MTVYSDSFGIEDIPQEVLIKTRDKSITHNIFNKEDVNSVMCGFYCIVFIQQMFAGNTLFSYEDYKHN